MIIANPVYDTIFKYLMFEHDIAKRFLSVILNVDIIKLTFNKIENAQVIKERELSVGEITLYRLDFIAEIATSDGIKTVLIELQKSWDSQDIYRFRNYLAEEYARHYTAHLNYLDSLKRIRKERKNQKKENKDLTKLPTNDVPEALPIVAVYIIDHKLYYDNMIVHSEPICKDPNNKNKILQGKDDFIENLTHNSYFIQIPHIPDDPNTELEEVLSIFNQTFLLPNDHRKIDYQKSAQEINNDLLQDMLALLNKLSLDKNVSDEIESREKGRKLMEKQDLVHWAERARMEDEMQEKLDNKDKELDNKDKELESKNKELEKMQTMINKLQNNNKGGQ